MIPFLKLHNRNHEAHMLLFALFETALMENE
jgi:hypothetical protein